MIKSKILVLIFVSLVLSGCSGSMKYVQKSNSPESISNSKRIDEGIHLLTSIISTYDLAALSEDIILKAMELWNESDVDSFLDGVSKRTVQFKNLKAQLIYSHRYKVLNVEISNDGAYVYSFDIVPMDSGQMALKNRRGKILMTARSDEKGNIFTELSTSDKISYAFLKKKK